MFPDPRKHPAASGAPDHQPASERRVVPPTLLMTWEINNAPQEQQLRKRSFGDSSPPPSGLLGSLSP